MQRMQVTRSSISYNIKLVMLQYFHVNTKVVQTCGKLFKNRFITRISEQSNEIYFSTHSSKQLIAYECRSQNSPLP